MPQILMRTRGAMAAARVVVVGPQGPFRLPVSPRPSRPRRGHTPLPSPYLVEPPPGGYNRFQQFLNGIKPMKAPKAELTRRLDEVEEEFVGLWRTMSSLWGISPTMAEI